MIVLTVRTDKPEAEIGLYQDETQIAYETWQAHRALAETIHQRIQGLLEGRGLTLQDIGGIISYKGPGSFTGLRIGLSVTNTLASSLKDPHAGVEGETDWIRRGLALLGSAKAHSVVLPSYGGDAHITPAVH